MVYVSKVLQGLQEQRRTVINSHKDEEGFLLLHLAAYFGHDELVRTLLVMGAAVDVKSAQQRWRMLGGGGRSCAFGLTAPPPTVSRVPSVRLPPEALPRSDGVNTNKIGGSCLRMYTKPPNG